MFVLLFGVLSGRDIAFLPERAFGLCASKIYLLFLISTAFVGANTKYGIPFLRCAVFLKTIL